MKRRMLITMVAAATGATLLSPVATAQSYPDRAIRIVVPYPPGGTSDIIARALAEPMQKLLGQPVLVDNRGGASGAVGTIHVARSAPDGYTLLLPNNAFSSAPLVQSDASYDPIRDFDPVSLVGVGPALLIVNGQLPARSVRELIELAASSPGKLEYATSGGAGSFGHLVTERFSKEANVRMLHVPYKGGGPATMALLSGESKLIITTLNDAMRGFIADGRLRVLGSTAPLASPLAPGVAPISQTLPGFKAEVWHGIVAPKGTPSAVLSRLNGVLRQVLAMPEIQQKLMQLGFQASSSTPEGFGEVIALEHKIQADTVRAANIKAE